MSHIPNKPTLIAAGIYGACTQIESGKNKLAWNELDDAQRKPFFAASEFLTGQVFGASVQRADRAKLAAGLELLKLDSVDGDANVLVSIFVSISSALPSA